MESLKREIPLVTEFGFEEAKGALPIQIGAILLNVGRRFEPPSQREIDQYAKTVYPEWIERCEGILRRLPAALEHHREPVLFSFSGANEGSFPGKHVLVTSMARGNFLVRPPRESDYTRRHRAISQHCCGSARLAQRGDGSPIATQLSHARPGRAMRTRGAVDCVRRRRVPAARRLAAPAGLEPRSRASDDLKLHAFRRVGARGWAAGRGPRNGRYTRSCGTPRADSERQEDEVRSREDRT